MVISSVILALLLICFCCIGCVAFGAMNGVPPPVAGGAAGNGAAGGVAGNGAAGGAAVLDLEDDDDWDFETEDENA